MVTISDKTVGHLALLLVSIIFAIVAHETPWTTFTSQIPESGHVELTVTTWYLHRVCTDNLSFDGIDVCNHVEPSSAVSALMSTSLFLLFFAIVVELFHNRVGKYRDVFIVFIVISEILNMAAWMHWLTVVSNELPDTAINLEYLAGFVVSIFSWFITLIALIHYILIDRKYSFLATAEHASVNESVGAESPVSMSDVEKNGVGQANAKKEVALRSGKPRPLLTFTSSKFADMLNNAIYLLQAFIGLLELVLAALISHAAGIVFGMFSLAIAFTAFVDNKRSAFAFLGSETITRNVIIRSVWEMVRVLVFGFTFVLLVMRVASPDPSLNAFPSACPSGVGCVRVSLESRNPHGNGDLNPPIYHTSVREVFKAGLGVGHNNTGWQVIYSEVDDASHAFAHFRIVSGFWGVPDDIYVRFSCVAPIAADGGAALVEIQTQARLGTKHDDFEVNFARASKFLEDIHDVHAEFKPEVCK